VSEGIDGGRAFRQAWIDGVRAHYSGDPKPGYVAPREETPDWERQSASAVFGQVVDLLTASNGAAARLTRPQKGQFIAACWTAQIYMRISDPKPAYVAPWEDLPVWQLETDADISRQSSGQPHLTASAWPTDSWPRADLPEGRLGRVP
jgi:hypothetical protein